MEPRLIDDIIRRLFERLPPAAGEMPDEMRAHMRAALKSVLGKMDLVTREEFDVQAAVLQRTREKLTQMLERLAELEEQIGARSGRSDGSG